MKTKVFTKNKNGKIEFTEKELKALLDEIYDDGYADGSKKYYYTTPYYYHTPYWYTTTTPLSNAPSSVSYTTTASSGGDSGVTITSGSYTTDSTVATINDSKQGGKKSTYKYIIKGNK